MPSFHTTDQMDWADRPHPQRFCVSVLRSAGSCGICRSPDEL